MAVPASGSAYLKNTTGGEFSHAKQGGTILNNNSTTITNSVLGDGIITNALELDDASDNNRLGTFDSRPLALADGLQGNKKIASGGDFAYNASSPTLSDPTWVLSRVSTTLAGVANTKLLFMGRGWEEAIPQSRHSFGAQTVTAFRYDRFTWTGTLVNGASNLSRHNWLAAGSASVSLPAALNNTWKSTTNSGTDSSDSAANPTRSTPGELVMKVDFVTLAVTDTDSGDFYDYAPITGM